VTLDLCPTSNVQAGVVPDLAAHPLARLARAGVPVTLSTDDRTVSDLTLVREYLRAVSHVGLRPVELAAVARHAYEAAFLHHDEELRTELLAAFDAWLEGRPPPAPDGHAASGE
jgi:adenosine deaminase